MIGFRYGWAPAASADDRPIQDGTFQFAEPAGLVEWLLGAADGRAAPTDHDLLWSAADDLGVPPLVDAILPRQPWPPGFEQLGAPPRKPPPIRETIDDAMRAVEPINLMRLPPEMRILYHRESTGDPFAHSLDAQDRPHVGLAQFGQAQLAELGYYVGDGDLTDQLWTGHFENLDGVYDVIDFMNDVDAQNEVLRAHFAYIDDRIAAMGLDRYLGRTVGGVVVTPSGLRYGAHLGGLGGLRDWLRGGDDESDGNTRISDYVRMGLRVPFEFTP